ncbi:MAG: hypothetical protein Q9177_003694 [Variospora cf. flavescens]
MAPFLTRLVQHLRDVCDDHIDRIEDSETGHRDRYGRKTHLYYQREYEERRRRAIGAARRRKKEMIQRKQHGEQTDRSGGRKRLAVMSGATNGEDSEEDENRGGHGDNPKPDVLESTEGTTVEGEHERGQHGVAVASHLSPPPPSEHSLSSTRAHFHHHSRGGSAGLRFAAGSALEGLNQSDNEEEEAFSDEGSLPSEEGDEAIISVEDRAIGNAGPSPLPSLRGGGAGIAKLDSDEDDDESDFSSGDEEYDERENFDDEYVTPEEELVRLDCANSASFAGSSMDGPKTAARYVSETDHENEKGADKENHVCKKPDDEHTAPDVSTTSGAIIAPHQKEVRSFHNGLVNGQGIENVLGSTSNEASSHTALGPIEEDDSSIGTVSRRQESASCSILKDDRKVDDIQLSHPSQPKGQLQERKPRPYNHFGVHETLKVERPKASAKAGTNPQDRRAGVAEPQSTEKTSSKKVHTPKLNSLVQARDIVERITTQKLRGTPKEVIGQYRVDVDLIANNKPMNMKGLLKRNTRENGEDQCHLKVMQAELSTEADLRMLRKVKVEKPVNVGIINIGNVKKDRVRLLSGRMGLRMSRKLEAKEFMKNGIVKSGIVKKEESSDEDSRDPSPAPSPSPPPRRRKHYTKEKRPPISDDVDSAKTAPLDHYAVLGISPDATAKDIEIAGKKMRIQTHPDRLLEPGMMDSEKEKINAKSARVGQAHELLKDPAQRHWYDDEIRKWKREHGGVLPPEQV